MRKITFILLMFACLTAMAQDKVLRIPYAKEIVLPRQTFLPPENEGAFDDGQNAEEGVKTIEEQRGGYIYGIISEPEDSTKKHGIAIISHGFNGTHQFGHDYFKTLNELGYAVYSFDFPCGSVYSQTDNNTMNMSVLDEKEALETIVKYFQKQRDIDNQRIVLIGESQGGLVSALAAAELKKQVSALVLIYPALCIPDNWNARYPRVEDIPEVSEIWGVKLGKKFMLDIRTVKPFETIGKYEGNVLIVHGTNDKVVPIDYSKRAQQTYQNATLKIIENAGHGFKPEERKLSNQYVKEFLTSTAQVRTKEIAPELEYVCELKVTCDSSYTVGRTSHGERVVIPITGGTFEGPRMKGTVLSGGADYQLIDVTGNRTELEAIYSIRTDDGVNIHIRNVGLLVNNSGNWYFRTAPRFEAPSDSKYNWLNDAIFVCVPEGKKDYISLKIWMVK